jgi:DNA-binding transcriptional LysR family regulator
MEGWHNIVLSDQSGTQMNLRQIEVFRAIMVTGSVTGAAQLLHVSQPGVSRLVRYVEVKLGVPLFERKGGKILPTPEARALYAEVEKAYRGVKRIQDYAAGLKSGLDAVVRVATSPSLGLELVPRAIARLASVFPAARLTVEVLPVAQMVDLLLAEQLDLCVSTLEIDHPSLELAPIGEWRLLCAFPRGHPIEAKARLSLGDVLRYRVISYSREAPQARFVDQWCAKHKVERKGTVEVRSGHMACAMVAAGAGIAIVDELSARAYGSARLATRPVHGSPVLTIYTVLNRNRPASEIARKFCELAAEAYRELRRPKQATA